MEQKYSLQRRILFLFLVLCGSPTVAGVVADPMTAKQHQQTGWQAYQRGAFEQAVVHWLEAATLYEHESKILEQSDALLRLGEAYQALGRYPKAAESLDAARRLATQARDPVRQVRILGSLGALAISAAQYTEAEEALTEGLRLSRELGNSSLSAMILNNLGNAKFAQRRYADALTAYADSLSSATTVNSQSLLARARINQAAALAHLDRFAETKEQLDQAVADYVSVPPSHDQTYALITIGLAYDKLRPHLPTLHADLMKGAFQAYSKAAEGAEMVSDHRAASYAWGYLGQLYEAEHRHEEALDVTRRAILAGQQAVAPEALYRWHRQSGRLFTKLGKPTGALDAYRRAVFALQSVRTELIAASEPSSSSFREVAGTVYFELADLLLQRAAALPDRTQSEPYLKEARDVVELFKVDELRNYLGDECVDAARSRITSLESAATTAAVIYPIVLPDRLELLVSFPTGFHRVTVPVRADQLTQEVRTFRQFLEKRTTREYLPHAQQLYDWLIRPLNPVLTGRSIDTLVFVPDGPFRTIPMAALHDGTRFLIQQYAVATTPGLTLTDPRPLNRQTIQALSAGLTESVQGYSSLPNVAEEVRMVNDLFGGDVLLNQEFLLPRVETELKEKAFSVMHIASHGQFESDAHKSFLLAYDGKLTMDRLEQFVGLRRFREEPIALLTLSACETAAGDDRAALGLAGIAIKAGARSALATLWFINDEASVSLMSEFYRQLHDSTVSKAVALQRAQLKMLAQPIYQHPAYWAPFLLLNNWL